MRRSDLLKLHNLYAQGHTWTRDYLSLLDTLDVQGDFSQMEVELNRVLIFHPAKHIEEKHKGCPTWTFLENWIYRKETKNHFGLVEIQRKKCGGIHSFF
jgi:hypothetical protein